MRVLITGSRTWLDRDTIEQALNNLNDRYGECTLVSGHCPDGADALCEDVAESLGWTIERYPADWDRFGKRAGFERNKEMVDTGPDICLAFIHNNSKGATMTANLAENAGVPTIRYERNDT